MSITTTTGITGITGTTGATGPGRSCWINNLSLVNYDVELYPTNNILIDYVNVSIVFSKYGYRTWNFVFAGNTSLTSFTQIFMFNKDCEVSGLFLPCTPNQVWFSPKGFKGFPLPPALPAPFEPWLKGRNVVVTPFS